MYKGIILFIILLQVNPPMIVFGDFFHQKSAGNKIGIVLQEILYYFVKNFRAQHAIFFSILCKMIKWENCQEKNKHYLLMNTQENMCH